MDYTFLKDNDLRLNKQQNTLTQNYLQQNYWCCNFTFAKIPRKNM